MKKKGISKLMKLKIMFYSFFSLPIIVFVCSIFTYFVDNVIKYWLNLIITNYLSIIIFFVLGVLNALILLDSKGKQNIILMIVGTLISGLLFTNLALPLDRYIYM